MKRFFLIVLLLLPVADLHAAELPRPLAPAPGAVIFAPHPQFRWQREADVKIDEAHRIQIARDELFADLACDDRLEVVSRFVPIRPLVPGKYWWRVRRGEGDWSAASPFEVREPEMKFRIRSGSDVSAVLREAASHTPARVDFEPGEYRFADLPMVKLEKVRDLIMDGHGAKLVLSGTLLSLTDCQRITIQNFVVASGRPGHTLVRIVRKGDAGLVAKPEPGYDPDVAHFFEMKGTGGSFLGCMDPHHHGKYLPGAGISARTVKVASDQDAFVFSPVKPADLDLIPVGAVAVVTAYRWQWIQMNRTDECTFSHVTVSDLPGAFCGGSNNSAKSYLACNVRRRAPEDYCGGHAACGSGRVGEWVEGCEFECLPDDGPAEQSFRQSIKGADGPDAILLPKSQAASALRAGDRITVVNPKTRRGAAANVLMVNQAAGAVRVQFDRTLAELAPAIGTDWSSMFLYCDAPSNEDFVYRRNRHVGGRGHGVKFNGTRAWIADNHFENISGNAVLAGYASEVSGHGARDVVISGNTVVRCGWTPIEITSTSGLGGNIIIRTNQINEIRDAGIYVRGCSGVSIVGNTFTSMTKPKQGAWIILDHAEGIQLKRNAYPADIPETKYASPRK